MFEENISLVNEIIEEEQESNRESEEKQKENMNFNPNDIMKNASNMQNSFKPPKI